jgi:phosphoribosylformimino-5-aminoimidazole carboxamide ribotide isomerase
LVDLCYLCFLLFKTEASINAYSAVCDGLPCIRRPIYRRSRANPRLPSPASRPPSPFPRRIPLAVCGIVCHIVRFAAASGHGQERNRVEIWPAIDLRGGKCVRLRQGDYNQETVFGSDPAAMARHWAALGAEHLHLVDLDGAREGRPANLASIRSIVEAVGIPCELGGGIRNEESIRSLLDLGLARLVIGTLAVREPDWFRAMCRKFPGRLVLGIDARGGRVATEGWLATSDVSAVELAERFAGEPIAALVYTDIAVDGMMAGPNVAAMSEMQAAVKWPVVASGGVATCEDVARLAAVPMAGCIIGRALYEGTLTLPEALTAAGGES